MWLKTTVEADACVFITLSYPFLVGIAQMTSLESKLNFKIFQFRNNKITETETEKYLRKQDKKIIVWKLVVVILFVTLKIGFGSIRWNHRAWYYKVQIKFMFYCITTTCFGQIESLSRCDYKIQPNSRKIKFDSPFCLPGYTQQVLTSQCPCS